MRDLVDRVCRHGYVLYCPDYGCHDYISYGEPSGGVALLMELLEEYANTGGALPMFHAKLDPRTGMDGIDELTESIMLGFDHEEGLDLG